jgi:hypothetical protein
LDNFSAYTGTVSKTSARAPRVRRVTRVIREIDPWSAFRVGLAFHLVVYFTVLIVVQRDFARAAVGGSVDHCVGAWGNDVQLDY